MPQFLQDTCALSSMLLARPEPELSTWLSTGPAVFVSVLSIGELRRGTDLLGDTEARWATDPWIDTLIASWHRRIIGVDEPISRTWLNLPGS